MGYPMTFQRLLGRNRIDCEKGYDSSPLAGDMKRWVENIQDHAHVEALARLSGATDHQVRAILNAILTDEGIEEDFSVQVIGYPTLNRPTAQELTRRADRMKIADLEDALRSLGDTFNRVMRIQREDYLREHPDERMPNYDGPDPGYTE